MSAELLAMLSYRRPAGSKTEREFRERFLMCIPGAMEDEHKNIVVEVGEGSTTLFSCHTDTVHKDGGKQEVLYDAEMKMAYKADKAPLGADDGAGCWIMLQMIRAGVPGVYIFHHGEERGGIGSSDKAEFEPDWFKRFRRAVAFDRREVQDVITHQAGGRCCSDSFAHSLALALNAADSTFNYMPCDGGIFTDTANYIELVPECTNLSVGYMDEHRPSEMLDVAHVERLADAAIKIDWEALPTERDPADTPSWRRRFTGGKQVEQETTVSEAWAAFFEAKRERVEDILADHDGDPIQLAESIAELQDELDDVFDELRELREWRAEREYDEALAKRREVPAIERSREDVFETEDSLPF